MIWARLRGFFLGRMDLRGNLGFRGELGIKVIRANPTKRQRMADRLAELLGRRSV